MALRNTEAPLTLNFPNLGGTQLKPGTQYRRNPDDDTAHKHVERVHGAVVSDNPAFNGTGTPAFPRKNITIPDPEQRTACDDAAPAYPPSTLTQRA